MTPIWMEAIIEAAKKGSSLSFRAEHQREDWFICIAEWQEGGVARSERTLRFRCDSSRQADFLAGQLMREQLKISIFMSAISPTISPVVVAHL